MMHFINRCHSSLLKATLTQWVCRHITLTNPSPRSAVPDVHISSAFILVVSFVLYFLVLFTILFLGKVRTAGEGTRPFRFSWQVSHLLRGKRKALRISPQGSFIFFLSIIIRSHQPTLILSHLLSSCFGTVISLSAELCIR